MIRVNNRKVVLATLADFTNQVVAVRFSAQGLPDRH